MRMSYRNCVVEVILSTKVNLDLENGYMCIKCVIFAVYRLNAPIKVTLNNGAVHSLSPKA